MHRQPRELVVCAIGFRVDGLKLNLAYVVDKVPLSLRGRGVSFILLPACLPFAPSKFQEIRKFHEILIAFEQIPEIPKKFREIFVEKCAI